jgi:hypothetical protein
MKYVITFFFLFFRLAVYAQVVSDDFSDGDFTHNPTWKGDSADFIINTSGQLQLYGTFGTSCLSTRSPVTALKNNEWRFYIRENFSPSGNNNGKVYLVSSRSTLTDSLYGYYLQFGEAGSNDAIELFRQEGFTSTSVCRGINGEIASSFFMSVKVLRDSTGKWTLLTDTQGGTNYLAEASGADTTISSSAFLGVMAIYTTSDATKFYWTDFYAGPVYVDHTLPVVSMLEVISATQLDVVFNETVDSVSACQPSNYMVDKGLGHPFSIVRDSTVKSLVHLLFANPILPATSYLLQVKQVKNLVGDSMHADSEKFWIYTPKAYDVVINEVMARPSPAQNLPPYEYVELYNRTAFPIALDNWSIWEGNKAHLISGLTILPDSFVVLCSATAAASFNPSLPVFGVYGFSALNNTTADLALTNNFGAVMSAVTYSDSWYADASKKNGGWSLEQIDPANPCGGSTNWKASLNPNGGTPGTRNSVEGTNPDLMAPQVLRVAVLAADTIQLFFDEAIDSTTMQDPGAFAIDKNIRIDFIRPVGKNYKSIVFGFQNFLMPGVIYTLSVQSTLKDCAGNVLRADQSARFALPVEALPGDLVINEILSDPKKEGVKYVEIYNPSSKVIDLKQLNLSTEDSVSGLLMDTKIISTENFLIFPADYLLLSTSQSAVKKQYRTLNPTGFLDLAALPKMNIDAGTVVLVNTSGVVIDKLVYSSTWQFPLLSSNKGVSLERIDYTKATQDEGNWHSAAENAGFGTPGYRNSEYMHDESDSGFSLSDEIFSPDDDGHNDILGIRYHMPGPDFVGNITIYDSRGRLIRSFITNTLLATEGSFNWDGTGDNREKAAVGIYIILFEAWDSKGTVKTFRKACVLAGKL